MSYLKKRIMKTNVGKRVSAELLNCDLKSPRFDELKFLHQLVQLP